MKLAINSLSKTHCYVHGMLKSLRLSKMSNPGADPIKIPVYKLTLRWIIDESIKLKLITFLILLVNSSVQSISMLEFCL